MQDKKQLPEGAISVEGNITPISREPIEQIDSSQWEMMPLNELVDQRIALNNRIILAQSMGLGHVIQQMQRGLLFIDALITEKQKTTDTHLL